MRLSKVAPVVRRVLSPQIRGRDTLSQEELKRRWVLVKMMKKRVEESAGIKESPKDKPAKMPQHTTIRRISVDRRPSSGSSTKSENSLRSRLSESPTSSVPQSDFSFEFDVNTPFTSPESTPEPTSPPKLQRWAVDPEKTILGLEEEQERPALRRSARLQAKRDAGQNDEYDDAFFDTVDDASYDKVLEEETKRANVSFGLIYEASRAAFFDDLGESYYHEEVQDPEQGLRFLRRFEGKKPGYAKASQEVLVSAVDCWTNNITMGGQVKIDYEGGTVFNPHAQPVFSISLDPLGTERSCRFFRKFGSDRFLFLRMQEMPRDKMKQDRFKKDIKAWIANGIRVFDRWWKPFHIKQSTKSYAFQIVFFAEKGFGIGPSRNPALFETTISNEMTAEELLEWHIPLQKEQNSSIAKIQSRIDLGFSDTEPTIEFQWDELMFTSDNINPVTGEIMDDGCAVASPEVFRQIAQELGLETVPTAMQGRLGGAKGVWFMQPITPGVDIDSQDIFIAITPSMLKYQWHDEDMSPSTSDGYRLTLDVINVSKKPKESQLNLQFLPLLDYCGVPFEALEEITEECFKRETDELEAALDDPLKLRYWLGKTGPIIELQHTEDTCPYVGGWPAYDKQSLEMLIDAGFEVNSCSFMQHILQTKVLNRYWKRLMTKFHIAIPMSTSLMCIADPSGTLEEGEVWLSFSEGMLHTLRRRKEEHICGDILVARNPALLPSDIQKVRAVEDSDKYKCFRDMKDVIIFSTKGDRSLASILSGGDYDGDKIWITWDPRLVIPFQTQPLSTKYTFDKDKYFEVRKEKVGDYDDSEILPTLIASAIEPFTMSRVELGTFTNIHASHVYSSNDPGDEIAFQLAQLCAYLVDSRKQGFTLKQTADTFKKYGTTFPHYKAGTLPKGVHRDSLTNICDRICFQVIQKQVKEAQKRTEFKPAKYDPEDSDLTALYRHFDSQPTRTDKRTILHKTFESLKEELDAIMAFLSKYEAGNARNFDVRANTARQHFLDIEPYQSSSKDALNLTEYWRSDVGQNEWLLMKASVLYQLWHRRSPKMIWWVCGKELCEIKARAGGWRSVREEIHRGLVVDRRRVRKTMEDEEEDDVFFDAKEY